MARRWIRCRLRLAEEAMTDVAHRAETASTTPGDRHDCDADQPSSRRESTLIPAMMSIVTVLVVLVIAIRPVRDVDVWWHLKAGQFLLNGGAFVGPDPWVPFATRPFILNQWLPEIIAFKGYTWFGLPAVAWLRCVGILLILSAILWCTRRVADTAPALITALAALVGTAGSLSERPQLVSFVLLAVWVGASWRTAEDLRPRWWLIPLTWVWACSHGMWITGIGVGVIVILGLLLDRRIDLRVAGRMMLVPIASLAVVALTPVGPRLLLTPFEVAENATSFIQEWQPTNLRGNGFAIVAIILLAGAVVSWIRSGSAPPWWQIGLAAVGFVSILMMNRTIPVGAIISAPLAAASLQRLRQTKPHAISRGSVRSWGALIVVAALLAAPVSLVVARRPALTPEGLRPALSAIPAGSVILDDFSVSGWLLWAEPDLTPVIDLRSEVYSKEYFEAYRTAEDVSSGWRTYVTRVNPTYALLRKEAPLRLALQEELRWTTVREDPSGYVLLRAP
jgi:hypothetical protein